MSEPVRRLALALGLPEDTRGSDVWWVHRYRRMERVTETSALVAAICQGLQICAPFGRGGSMRDVYRPLYTEEEWAEMDAALAEQREREAQIRQYETVKRMAQRWRSNRDWMSR